ncbi:MAG: DNA helicase PcrA [Tissierellales bacterium]|jgi:DNA helicase-2/ATP-dependent DNA helicase PcrA|nr:DNA helicase PcrA [Tissierellales bacterium]
MSKFVEGLNEKQKEAVITTEGPLLVLAGAGSGKTRVLTHRIAYIIEQKNLRPSQVMALTFTNKAAKEMKERLSALIEGPLDGMWVSTFHSICVRVLRREADKLGYTTGFVIYDSQDQKTLVKQCIKEKDLNEKTYEPKAILGFISKQKEKLLTPKESFDANFKDFRERTKAELYMLYQKKLKDNNAMDFDDLIINTLRLFKDYPLVLEYYQERFKYILVDEYQDTNRAQYLLVSLLAQRHQNLCVVGDDDQSIYGWRGADIRNILDFEKDYLAAKVIKLEQNYRSTKNILDAANLVIRNNTGRKEKALWTSQEDGDKITRYSAQNEQDEGLFVIKEIKNAIEKDYREYKDIAVLYRTNAQSRVFEDCLMKSTIPYKIVGGLKFYDRKEVKDTISYLRILQNPHDDISLKRIINVPKRGIGKTTIDRLEQYALTNEISLFEAAINAELVVSLSNAAQTKVKKFVEKMSKLMAMKEVLQIDELFEAVLDESQYIEVLKAENTIESMSRIDNIEEFKSVIVEFTRSSEDKTLEAFLADVSLMSDLDKTEEVENSVTLMTLHSAKGLEFPVVFMVGLEETIFPISRAMNTYEEMEEERRLCYVGITRAREKLYMTNAEVRMLYGRTQCNGASRFLDEIPVNLIEDRQKASISQNRKQQVGQSLNDFFKGVSYQSQKSKVLKEREINNSVSHDEEYSSGAYWNAGDKLSHKLFGVGTIVQLKGSGENLEAQVAFETKGIKKLMLNFAPVEKVK